MSLLSVYVLHNHLLCSTQPSLQLSILLLRDMLFGHVTFCLSADQLIDISYGTSNFWSIMNIDRSVLNANSDKKAFFQYCVNKMAHGLVKGTHKSKSNYATLDHV